MTECEHCEKEAVYHVCQEHASEPYEQIDSIKEQLKAIIAQLEFCKYECEAGPLHLNVSFIELKRIAGLDGVSDDQLSGCGFWITDTLPDGRVELTAPNGLVLCRVQKETADMIGRMLIDESDMDFT